MTRLSESLLEAFDKEKLARARTFLKDGRVGGLEQLTDGSEQVITATVRDDAAGPSRVYLRISDQSVDGDCSCSPEINCRHAAATLLQALADQTNQPDAGNRGSRDGEKGAARHRLLYLLQLDSTGQELAVCALRVPVGQDSGTRPFNDLTRATPFAPGRVRQVNRPDYLLAEDEEILLVMDEACPSRDGVWHGIPVEGGSLLQRIVQTGRACWESITSPALKPGPARRVRLQWQMGKTGTQELAFESRQGLDQLPVMPPLYLDRPEGTIGPLDSGVTRDTLVRVRALAPVEPDQVDSVRDEIHRLAASSGEPVPRPRAIELIALPESAPGICLELFSLPGPDAAAGNDGTGRPGSGILSAARLEFAYGDSEGQARIDWDHPGDWVRDSIERTPPRVYQVRRNETAERSAVERLRHLGLAPTEQRPDAGELPDFTGLWMVPEPDMEERAWPELIAGLDELESAGWTVVQAPSFRYRKTRPDNWQIEARATEDPDWFELDFSVEVEGKSIALLPLITDWIGQYAHPERLDLLSDFPEDRQITVRIDEQRVLLMPVARLRRIAGLLVDLFDAPPDLRKPLRVAGTRAGIAGIGEDRHWQLSAPDRLDRLTARLADFTGVDPVAVPDGLKTRLRDYQRAGLDWLQFLRDFELGGILADDMGLGKTVQTLAHLLVEKESGRMDRPSLVVAPTSLMFNWRAEARRFAPDLKVLMLHGPDRKLKFHRIGEMDLVLTTYPLVHRDLEVLQKQDWHLLILDEAQQVKNPRTRAARSVRSLAARHRLCLTGTPMENHLGELWSLMDFLMPGLLGNEKGFRQRFRNPVEKHGDEDARLALNRRLRPFFLRRTKAEVAPELPDKIDIDRTVALNEAQQALYDSVRLAMHDRVRKALNERGLDRSRIVVLDALLKLRQVCCHPRLLKNIDHGNAGSAKLDLLMDLVPPLIQEGRRILLFSQFTTMIGLIEAELKDRRIDYAKLTGKTRNREAAVEAFQTGRVPLFLISLKAGGAGLNLTAADTVIHYDPWWNPAVEDQATDRAHRIGQDNKVMVYRLLAENTVEERIHSMQKEKRGLLEGLFTGGGAGRLESRDLEILFEPA